MRWKARAAAAEGRLLPAHVCQAVWPRGIRTEGRAVRSEYRGVSAWARRFANGSFVLPWETSRDVSMVFVDEQVS